MTFPHGKTVYRLRAKTRTDPYNPDEQVPDWSQAPTELAIPGAFVAGTSTSLLRAASRAQAAVAKSLYCDGTVDVRKGDRIRNGPEGSAIYDVDGIPPEADTNPFTEWTPVREIPLTRWVG